MTERTTSFRLSWSNPLCPVKVFEFIGSSGRTDLSLEFVNREPRGRKETNPLSVRPRTVLSSPKRRRTKV